MDGNFCLRTGTIFVDGFVQGIGTDGIHGSVRNMKLPMRERLPVLCKLGHGASSVVYKALDITEMRLVALKMVSVYDKYAASSTQNAASYAFY